MAWNPLFGMGILCGGRIAVVSGIAMGRSVIK
jgi:hypothetical protein